MNLSSFHSCFHFRRPAALLLLTLAAWALSGCGAQLQNEAKIQMNLDEAFRRAQVDPTDTQARQWVDRAIAISPGDKATYLGSSDGGLSIAYIFGPDGVGDDPALADYMQQAIKKWPDDSQPYQLLADVQGRQGRLAARKATVTALIGVLNAQLKTPGTDVENLSLALAQAYWDAGDAVNGAKQGQSLVSAYPNDPTPANNLAYEYAVANTNLPAALALAQKALALAKSQQMNESQVGTFQDTLGWVQYRLHDNKNAEENLQLAAAAVPRLAEVRYHLGMVYLAEGKTEGARAELGHAVLLSKGYADAQAAYNTLPKPQTLS